MASSAIAPDTSVRRQSYLRELGVPALFGAIVLLGSATLLLFANVAALRGSLRYIEHSQHVLNRIADLETGILKDELTVRGYALTGDPQFLSLQKYGQLRSEGDRQELLRLAAFEPQRAAEYRQVMANVAWHLKTFAELRGNGPDRATKVARAIVDPAIRAKMRTTRVGLVSIREAEVRDLGERQRLMAEQITRAFVLAMGIILVAFILSGLGIWAVRLQVPLTRKG